MPDLIEIVEAMTPAEQAIAHRVLDACSRPLTAREIEGLLRKNGNSRTWSTRIASELKHWHLIAVVGPEQ